MSTRYRVIVERIEDVDAAKYETRETVLFEATTPNIQRLAEFAPREVFEALAAETDEEVSASIPGAEHVAPALKATVFDDAGREIPAAPAEAPKRKRRTKAEIEAERKAEAAAAAMAAAVGTENKDAGSQWPSAGEVAANHKALDTVDAPEPVASDDQNVVEHGQAPSTANGESAPFFNPFTR